MSENIQIEVLIPVYNCKNYLITCLKSIKNQTLRTKISITDDCSTDFVKPILEDYNTGEVTLNFNATNEGNLRTINNLLRRSTSKYIALQDADDWSEKDRLEAQVEFMEREGLDFCFTNFIKTANNGENLYCGYYKDSIITNENINDIEPSIAFASILFKREIYEAIGGFDEYFDQIGGADIDWFYRAFTSGFKGGIVKKPLYFYRNNDVSYTSKVSLDPRKYISVEIARYFYQYRALNKTNPPEENLNDFISTKLKEINFDVKSNLKDYIVQTISKKQYLSTLNYLIKYLFTKPLSLKDLKLIKYTLYKIKSGK